MALRKKATPKRWRSKEAKEIAVAVQRASEQVERTAGWVCKGDRAGRVRDVASAPDAGRTVGVACSAPWPRPGPRPGWTCQAHRRGGL
jgi:hypothetical protein